MVSKMISWFMGLIITLAILIYSYMTMENSYLRTEVTSQIETASLPSLTVKDFEALYSFNQSFNRASLGELSQEELMKVTSISTRVDIDYEVPELEHVGVNPNYIGRLSIPALQIEDSLYFSGDDFYLNNDRNGKANKAGELYIDGRSSGNLFALDNLVNGHSMNNETKLGKLKYIVRETEPVFIYIKDYASGRTFIYEVFATNLIDNENSGVYLTFNTSYERSLYYRKLKSTSLIKSDVDDFTPNILTVNTCDYNIKNGHLLVSAVLKGWR